MREELAGFCKEHNLAPDHVPTDMQVACASESERESAHEGASESARTRARARERVCVWERDRDQERERERCLQRWGGVELYHHIYINTVSPPSLLPSTVAVSVRESQYFPKAFVDFDGVRRKPVQEDLAHKKQRPPRTLK